MMKLPSLENAFFMTFDDPYSGQWSCYVGDTDRQVYGYTTGRTPLKATAKAIDALTGKTSPATIHRLTESMKHDMMGHMTAPDMGPVEETPAS